MIRGVIFDLDGVLVSTDSLHYVSWKEVADQEGIPFDEQINARLRGVSRMESLAIILERAARPYSAKEREQLAIRKNDRYRELLATLGPGDLLPGATEIVSALRRRGIKTAIGSSSRNTPMIVDRLGIRDLFDAIADGNDIRHSKPDPEVFLLAANRLGLPATACLVVEDAAAGLEAARKAGMAVLAVGAAAELPGADAQAQSLAETSVDQLLSLRPRATE